MSSLNHYVIQFVCFQTSFSAQVFHPIWKPFANSFLSRGIELLVLNEGQDSSAASAPYRFISQNWWPRDSFEQTFSDGRMPGGVGFGPVQVAQAGGFVLSDGIMPHGIDPRAPFSGSKLFVLGRGSPLARAEIESVQEQAKAEGALFFLRLTNNQENLFDWLLELRGVSEFNSQQREQIRTMLAPKEARRQVQLGVFWQSLRLENY